MVNNLQLDNTPIIYFITYQKTICKIKKSEYYKKKAANKLAIDNKFWLREKVEGGWNWKPVI